MHVHPAAVLPGYMGKGAILIGFLAALATIAAYSISLFRPGYRKPVRLARTLYAITALSVLATFAILAGLVYNYHFEYHYVFEHTGTGMTAWYRLAATWAGQEGSFLLWASWTSLLGFLVFAKAGRYEARIMPFYVSVLAFLCAILLKQSPFELFSPPSAAYLAMNPDAAYPSPEGLGLNPSLQNYWMTIHPPTIFFGFASLLVPFCYAVAALIWKDYEDWTPRVMPYALLSCATLGIGLFMGGYWAYETQGWHGFWAWDPVENASFIPWLAVTALIHSLVVQKSRGGMGRTSTFLGLLSFWLFLLGTFLTRSGVLQDVSIHAFANIGKSGLILMVTMLIGYGVAGLGLWLFRFRSIPGRKTTGDTLVSRDFAFFLAVTLLVLACVFVTLGTTIPLFQQWAHRPLAPPKAVYYNRSLMPLTMLGALLMGCVPWLAWRKTNPDVFLQKLVIPWIGMLAFGGFLLVWVLSAERAWQVSLDLPDAATSETLKAWVSGGLRHMPAPKMDDPAVLETMQAWGSLTAQRMAVITLASLGFLAALSNAMLAYRVFRSKPLAAGGWLAHVGMGVLIVGVVISNTYERTQRIVLVEGAGSKEAFGSQFAFEKMTGTLKGNRPLNPDYDKENAVQVRVTPPQGEEREGSDGSKTFVIRPRWMAYNLATARFEDNTEEGVKRIRWPDITKYIGHDLYVGLSNDPVYLFPGDQPDASGLRQGISLMPKEKRRLVDATGKLTYTIGYFDQFGEPGKVMGVDLVILTPDGKVVEARPAIHMESDEAGNMHMSPLNAAIPELTDENGVPGAAYLDQIDPATKQATVRLSLPGFRGAWAIPLEVTYKPWVNLVWAGVLIAFAGILLAMVNRALAAREVSDGPFVDAEKAVRSKRETDASTL